VPKSLADRIGPRVAPYAVYKNVYHPTSNASLPAQQVDPLPTPSLASRLGPRVNEQIDEIVKDDRTRRASKKQQQEAAWNPHWTLPEHHIERRKPLPPKVPSAKPLPRAPRSARLPARPDTPLFDRLEPPTAQALRLAAEADTICPAPIRCHIKFDFSKKAASDAEAVLQKRTDATINRIQAIFQRKKQFDLLPAQVRDDLHRVGDRLDYINEHLPELCRTTVATQESVAHSLGYIGRISFASLTQNYRRAASDLAALEELGYFAWAPVSRLSYK
jgi:hypothetical protein